MPFAERFPEGIWDPIEGYEKTGAFSADGVNDTKFVLHRTQGDSYPLSTYRKGGGVPHWTILHINQFSRALLNLRGGVQTNLDEALQVEIVGFTGNDMRPEQAATLGRLILWALENTGLQNVWLGGDPSIKNKLTFSEWDNGSGFIPHWFVPENNHHDTITHNDWLYLKAIISGETPPPKEKSMSIFNKPAGYVIRRTVPIKRDMYAESLQRELNTQMGWLGAPLTIDGYFGSATEVRVKKVQTALAVTDDGLWGDGSHTALRRYVEAKATLLETPVPVTPPAPAPASDVSNSAAVKKLLEDIEENMTVALKDVNDLISKLLG